MDPDRLRKCMSLGYSSKTSNSTIGQCELLPRVTNNWVWCTNLCYCHNQIFALIAAWESLILLLGFEAFYAT